MWHIVASGTRTLGPFLSPPELNSQLQLLALLGTSWCLPIALHTLPACGLCMSCTQALAMIGLVCSLFISCITVVACRNSRLVTSSKDKTVKVWSLLESGASCTHTYDDLHTDTVKCARWRDSVTFATCANDKLMRKSPFSLSLYACSICVYLSRRCGHESGQGCDYNDRTASLRREHGCMAPVS